MVLKIYYKPEGEENEAEGMTAFYCINLSNAMEYLVAYVTCHVNEEATNRLVVYDLEEHNVIAWHDAVMYKSTQLSKVLALIIIIIIIRYLFRSPDSA